MMEVRCNNLKMVKKILEISEKTFFFQIYIRLFMGLGSETFSITEQRNFAHILILTCSITAF